MWGLNERIQRKERKERSVRSLLLDSCAVDNNAPPSGPYGWLFGARFRGFLLKMPNAYDSTVTSRLKRERNMREENDDSTASTTKINFSQINFRSICDFGLI